MANFRDELPSQFGWLHELARTEIHPEADKIFQLSKSFDPQQVVEESTIEFLGGIRECLNEYSRLFNSYSESGIKFQDIKVYSLAQTAADFMLFRNQIKLIFSNSAHGVIQIAFAQHVRGSIVVSGQEQKSNIEGSSQELMAQLGPFRDVYWTFQGEKITPEQVAKYYFIEFSKVTRDLKKSKLGNQLLLDQIKALLQEKGLNL